MSAGLLRILFLSSLYSTPLQPARGIPNARIVSALKQLADVKVIAPVPYYPRGLVRGRPDLVAVADLPDKERDFDGNEVAHPRYAHLPRVGRALYPSLYGSSIFAAVRSEVRRFRPDVILTAWAFPDGVAAVAIGKLLGVPTVMRVMGSDINAFALEPARRPQIAWALRRATRVIAVSRALRGACVEVLAPGESTLHIDVIPTGVDASVFHPADRAECRAALGLDPERFIVVVPARLSPEKGIHHFLQAFASLPADVAVLVGDGPDAARLEALARDLGIRERVVFAGHQSEAQMRAYYSAADLVCLPSTEEGWPNVLLESFACGCPWVASDVGGVPELLSLTRGGLLARPSDPEDLAAKLREAKTSAWDRKAISESTRAWSLSRTAERYLASCAQALESDRRAKGEKESRRSGLGGPPRRRTDLGAPRSG